ncbi:MAG TPA: DUF2254 domain-containing protein [candidate division Zixibacteria bacterium]|nr:DUF2254 domain-containing protein [candidate division Zixibacteria bacterium]HEQ98286.1 DUF2254 domain-containing protein [candidate division Zixibacteria bacterium]
MKTKLLNVWESIRTSFYFIPGLMVAIATGLAIIMVYFDRQFEPDSYGFLSFFYSGGVDGARSILATIAGSMITVAGVTFSITIVALTLTTSQFGPRLLRNFVRHPGNQVVLGAFVGTFIYCLLVLGSIHDQEGYLFVPILSVNLSILLVIANVGILVYFIHHVSASIQADNVVQAVYNELLERLLPLFPDEIADDTGSTGELDQDRQARINSYRKSRSISAPKDGYLQAVDINGLLRIAIATDSLLSLEYRPGEYITADSTLVTVSFDGQFSDESAEDLANSFFVGPQRSPLQDAEYAIHQLVEIAVRALSPGINDPFTAISCIDRLGSAVSFLAGRSFPSSHHCEDEGKLRLVTKPWTFTGVVNAAFDQIRQNSQSNVAVTTRLLETLTMIAGVCRNAEQREALLRQGNMILRASEEFISEKDDKQDVQQRYQALGDALSRSADSGDPDNCQAK